MIYCLKIHKYMLNPLYPIVYFKFIFCVKSPKPFNKGVKLYKLYF